MCNKNTPLEGGVFRFGELLYVSSYSAEYPVDNCER